MRFRDVLEAGDRCTGLNILAAVSGGPDSSALLLLLERFRDGLGYRLEAGYFDHQLQTPARRDEEGAAVRGLCDHLRVPLHSGSAPVGELARTSHRSIEDQARCVRYAFLSEVAERTGSAWVAFGHTLDDQAETILLHIVRGSGLRGLAGMRAIAPWPFGGSRLAFRPLLNLTRAETAQYCRLRGVEPHTDLSNHSDRYARNRIRAEVMPLLRTFNPAVSAAIARLGTAAAETLDSGPNAGVCPPVADEALTLAGLRGLPPHVRTEALTRAYEARNGSRRDFSAEHRSALAALIDAQSQHSVDLPGGLTAYTDAEYLRFRRRGFEAEPRSAVSLEVPLTVPGTAEFGHWRVTAEVVAGGAKTPAPYTASIRLSELGALTLRGRRPGDRMRPMGLGGSKKLQDLFVDAHVPRSERDAVPVICMDGEPVWLVGVRRDERAAADSAVAPTVRLLAERIDDAERRLVG